MVTANDDRLEISVETSEEEVLWLEALGAGSSVVELAAAKGCSERDMYRSLNKLYVRLGVRNHTHALMEASRARSFSTKGLVDGSSRLIGKGREPRK